MSKLEYWTSAVLYGLLVLAGVGVLATFVSLPPLLAVVVSAFVMAFLFGFAASNQLDWLEIVVFTVLMLVAQWLQMLLWPNMFSWVMYAISALVTYALWGGILERALRSGRTAQPATR